MRRLSDKIWMRVLFNSRSPRELSESRVTRFGLRVLFNSSARD